MVGATVLLELDKQKRTAFSIIFVLTLGIGGTAFLLPFWKPVRPEDALTGALAFLVCILPLLALLFGSTSAAGIRKRSLAAIEEALPVHPLLRVFSAFLAGLFYFLLFAITILSLLGSSNVYDVLLARFNLFLVPIPWLIFYMIFLSFLAFTCSYTLNLPVAGAGIALALVFANLFLHSAVNSFYWITAGLYESGLLLTSVSSCLSTLIALMLVARKIERGRPIGVVRAIYVCLLILGGPILQLCILWYPARAAAEYLSY